MSNYCKKSKLLASDLLNDCQLSLAFVTENKKEDKPLKVLSLFSGCGGMDLGFEGGFVCNRKSINPSRDIIEQELNEDWVQVKKTKFETVFANDILPEAFLTWTHYLKQYGYPDTIYHTESIVDLVKAAEAGVDIFPKNVDIVTGGFPCQDFSLAGKRKGFNSNKDHRGKLMSPDEPLEETRGKLYFWMKKVIDITKPKLFVAENVKGLVNLGDVKDIIQRDFSQADGNGYFVFNPKVLHAGNYGVPESRERVIFIGVRKDVLNPGVLKEISKKIISPEYDPYPSPTHSYNVIGDDLTAPVCCRDVFKGLKEPEDSFDLSQKEYSHAKYVGPKSQGQTEIRLDSLGPTIRSEHHGNIEYRRLSEEHGGKYGEELNSGLKERRLTPRECALIQTFPPDYQFIFRTGYRGKNRVSASGAYKVIGNAVPPVLAYNIAMRIQEIWDLYFNN